MINYQAGKNALSCPLRITHCVPQEKFPQSQSRSLLINSLWAKRMDKIAGYNPCSFICVFMNVNSLLFNKYRKNDLDQYLNIFTLYHGILYSSVMKIASLSIATHSEHKTNIWKDGICVLPWLKVMFKATCFFLECVEIFGDSLIVFQFN